MSKSIKPKNNVYIDSTGIVHNRKLLSQIINEIGLITHPVGSIYISVNSTNPQTLFGGTWVQIKDTFLLACGNTYSNGATGGEASHTLILEEMPPDVLSGYCLDSKKSWATGAWSNYSNYGYATNTIANSQFGGGVAHNNMPPYLAVYVWKRTA